MGFNLLVGRCTVRPVLGAFTVLLLLLPSLFDLLLISSITKPRRHKCLGVLSPCINTTSLTVIYGELLFNDLNLWYSRKFATYLAHQRCQKWLIILVNFSLCLYLFLRLLVILINSNDSNFSKIPVDLELIVIRLSRSKYG